MHRRLRGLRDSIPVARCNATGCPETSRHVPGSLWRIGPFQARRTQPLQAIAQWGLKRVSKATSLPWRLTHEINGDIHKCGEPAWTHFIHRCLSLIPAWLPIAATQLWLCRRRSTRTRHLVGGAERRRRNSRAIRQQCQRLSQGAPCEIRLLKNFAKNFAKRLC